MSRFVLAFATLALAGALAPSFAQRNTKVSDHVSKIHDQYVKEFSDLSDFYKDGRLMSLAEITETMTNPRFGTSRLDRNLMKTHEPTLRTGTDSKDEFLTQVHIFGAHGRPLTDSNLKIRYQRLQDGFSPRTHTPVKNPKSHKEIDPQEVAKRLVNQWKKRPGTTLQLKDGVEIIEARPFVLNKKECLSCHTGMKLGDPVAIAVYNVANLKKK